MAFNFENKTNGFDARVPKLIYGFRERLNIYYKYDTIYTVTDES